MTDWIKAGILATCVLATPAAAATLTPDLVSTDRAAIMAEGTAGEEDWQADLLAWILQALFGIGPESVSYDWDSGRAVATFLADPTGSAVLADLASLGYDRYDITASDLAGSGLGVSTTLSLSGCRATETLCSFLLTGGGDGAEILALLSSGAAGTDDFALSGTTRPLPEPVTGGGSISVIAPVPLPASGLLLLAGLGLLGLRRRFV